MTVGNGQELPVTYIGNGELCTSSHNFKLDGILRVPNLASKLLFVHKLCLQNNAFYYFDAYRFSIHKLLSRKILYKGLSKDGIYPIPTSFSLSSNSSTSIAYTTSQVHQPPLAFALSSINSAQISLWH